MQAALATIWLCAALGALLGALPHVGTRLTAFIRTFAVVSAALVAGFSLLPHALLSSGVSGAATAAAAFVAIPLIERLVRLVSRRTPSEGLRLEISYAGLLVHRFGDGVAMRVEGHGADILLSLGAHEIPIVALVMLAYSRRGVGHALLRVALLGIASTLGCAAVEAMPGAFHDLHGWVDAIAAGILLHIVAHELLEASPAQHHALDVLGAVAAGVVLWAPFGEESGLGLGRAVLGWLLALAPLWLLGLLLSGALRAGGLHPNQRLGRGSPRAELLPESIALSLQLLGWPLAVLRVVGAWLLSAIAARIGRRVATSTAPLSPDSRRAVDVAPRALRFALGVERSLLEMSAWIVLGVLAAAYVEVLLPASSLPRGGPWLDLGATLVVGASARACSAAATPLAAALLSQGLPPESALFGLLLGTAMARATSATELERLGARAKAMQMLRVLIVLAGVAWMLSWALAPVLDSPALAQRPTNAGGPVAWSALFLLACFTLAGVLRHGVRGWLARALGASSRHSHAAAPCAEGSVVSSGSAGAS